MQITKTESNKVNGTSWHGEVIFTTSNALENFFGKLDRGHTDDKSQFDWNLELGDGTIFTIYDWKEYRPFGGDERIEFHIGGHKPLDTIKARRALEKFLIYR